MVTVVITFLHEIKGLSVLPRYVPFTSIPHFLRMAQKSMESIVFFFQFFFVSSVLIS